MIPRGLDRGARLEGGHLTVAQIEQPGAAEGGAHRCDHGPIERIIRALPTHHRRHQRQGEGIEGGEHNLHLRQVGPMVLTMSKLKQALGRDDRSDGGGGGIQAHLLRIESLLQSPPAGVVRERLQQTREAIIGEIQAVERPPESRGERRGALLHPGTHMIEAVVPLGKHVSQPNGSHPARAKARPIAVRREPLVDQRGQPHPFHLCKQERDVINAFGEESGDFGHTEISFSGSLTSF